MWKSEPDDDLRGPQKSLWFMIGVLVGLFIGGIVLGIRVHTEVAAREACAKKCGCFEYEVRDDGCWCLAEPKRE